MPVASDELSEDPGYRKEDRSDCCGIVVAVGVGGISVTIIVGMLVGVLIGVDVGVICIAAECTSPVFLITV
jgi:hypothetical protein